MDYKVTLTQCVDADQLDTDDIAEFGEHSNGDVVCEKTYDVTTEEEALDRFNSEVPIHSPENYDVVCEEVANG